MVSTEKMSAEKMSIENGRIGENKPKLDFTTKSYKQGIKEI